MEFIVGVQEAAIKGFSKETKDKDMGKCFGQMGIFIEANGMKGFNMEKVNFM